MTQNDIAQPLTRRERRLLEQQASQPSAPPTDPLGVPTTTPTAQQPAVTLPAVPPPALSRRERRLLETAGTPVQETPSSSVLPPPATASTEALTQLLPPPGTQEAQPLLREPAGPLPPVFGVAVDTARFESFDDSAGGVPTPANFRPSRVVGDLTTATSSLIMPHTPTVDIAGPLGDTGEIVVTGQIRLPSSLSERGSAPAVLENNEHDEVMDAYVTGAIAPTAKPMRASQAVSGKGDDTDILLVRRARWGTATVVTALSAGVLGLAALGLFVLALLTDVVG
jgi:hypothetical protein